MRVAVAGARLTEQEAAGSALWGDATSGGVWGRLQGEASEQMGGNLELASGALCAGIGRYPLPDSILNSRRADSAIVLKITGVSHTIFRVLMVPSVIRQYAAEQDRSLPYGWPSVGVC